MLYIVLGDQLGHSIMTAGAVTVAALLRIYAKCIAGQQEEAMRRIFDATQDDQQKPGGDDGQDDGKPSA